MQAFEELLKRLRETTKSFNGRMVGDNITRPCPDKVLAIDKAEKPFIEKQVRSFFGLVLFLDIFLFHFFSHCCFFDKSEKKGDLLQKAFDSLKKTLTV